MIDQKNGGDGGYTTKAQKVDRTTITKGIYLKVHFLMSLNTGGTMLDFNFIFLQA